MSIRRTPKYPPSQTRISVQDTYDASTPQGTAQINEELRRIQLGVNAMADKVEAIDPKVASIEKTIAPPVGGRGGGGDSPLYNYITNMYGSGALPEKGEKGESGISGQNGKDGFVADYFGIEVQTDLTDLSAFPDYKTNKINFVNPSGNLPVTYIETPIHFSGSMADDTPLWQQWTGANDNRYRADINAIAYVDMSGMVDVFSGWASGYDWSGIISGVIASGIYQSGLDAGGIEVQINSADIPGHLADYKINKINFIDPTLLPDDYVISQVVWSGQIIDDTTLWQAATGGSDNRYSSEMKGFVYVDMSGIYSGVDTYISGTDWSGYFSGALLSGEKGEKGDQGDPGISGAKGDKGDKGDTGDPGVSGVSGASASSEDKGWIWYFTKNESDIPQYLLFDCNRPDDLWSPGDGNVSRGSTIDYVQSGYSGNIDRLDISGDINYSGQLGYNGWSGYHGKISDWDSHSGWITPSGFPVAQLSHVGNWFANVIIGHTLSDYDLSFWRYGISGVETLIDYMWIPPLAVDTTHAGYDYSFRWHYKQHQVEKRFNCEHWDARDRLVVKIGIRTDKDDHDSAASSPALTTGGVMRNYPLFDPGDQQVPPENQYYPALYEDNTVYDENQILTTYEPSHIRMPIPEAWYGDGGNNYSGITTVHVDDWGNHNLIGDPHAVDTLEFVNGLLPITNQYPLGVYNKFYLTSETEAIYPEGTPTERTVILSSGFIPRGDIDDIVKEDTRHGITSLHNEQLITSVGLDDNDVAQHTVTLNWQDINDQTSGTKIPVYVNFYHDIIEEPNQGYQHDSDPEYRVTTWASGHFPASAVYDAIASGTAEEVDPYFFAWDKAAEDIVVNASGFDGNLTSGDTNVQLCMQKLDDLNFYAGGISPLVNIQTMTTSITLSPTSKHYQYIKSSATYSVNLPNAGFSEGASFTILNTNIHYTEQYFELKFNGVTQCNVHNGTVVRVVFNGSNWMLANEMWESDEYLAIDGLGYGRGANGQCGGTSIGHGSRGMGGVAIGYNATTYGDNAQPGIALGRESKCKRISEFWISADNLTINKAGRGQYSWLGTTTNATQTHLYGIYSSDLTILPNSAMLFKIDVIAQKSDGAQAAGYIIDGVIKNDGGTTSFTGTPTIRIIGEDDPAWSAIVEADNTNDALAVKVTGVADTTITWHAAGYYTEVRL